MLQGGGGTPIYEVGRELLCSLPPPPLLTFLDLVEFLLNATQLNLIVEKIRDFYYI